MLSQARHMENYFDASSWERTNRSATRDMVAGKREEEQVVLAAKLRETCAKTNRRILCGSLHAKQKQDTRNVYDHSKLLYP